jgi:cytochrome c
MLIGCAVLVLASLTAAHVHPFGDAGLYEPRGQDGGEDAPIIAVSHLPLSARAILAEKCADCHSNQAHAPVYGRLAPASWLMERDIIEARRGMNLSLWNTYSAEQQQTLLARILHEAKLHKMPPLQYRMVHWNARITDADLEILGQAAHNPGAQQSSASTAGEGSAARGQELFEKRCIGCHTLTRNSTGPRLQDVYGRTSGALADYAYSAALRKAHIVWDSTSLDRWLADPDVFIPGNEMDFLISNPQERRDLISYLKWSSGK